MEWLRYQDNLIVSLGTYIDAQAVLLLIVVTFVSTLVHVYSVGYMHGDPGYPRYFTWLSLFTFSMLGLVLAPNLMQMFVFWELVGASSFLLIGFYYKTGEAMAASKKAFVVTRFADLFFLIGILLLAFFGFQIVTTPSVMAQIGENQQVLDFDTINNELVLHRIRNIDGIWGYDLLTISMVLIFIGAAGKSAMFPLHVWLPDAMAGPTPVSALIHAATMVVAGVFLVGRLFPAFAASETALHLVAYVGCFTCLFAAVIACTQTDIKRVLAFSTLSQLGYMMFAIGVATVEHPGGLGASMYHLYTHAFFKALLFLGAGSVIHAVHSNEVTEMGGLKSKMPITHATFLLGTMAIAGVPLLSGFWSKDEILSAAYDSHLPAIFVVGLFVACLTAFYMFRLYFLTFGGNARTKGAQHAHEAPASMTAPLCILAFLSVFAGYFSVSHFVLPGVEHEFNWIVASLSTLAAGVGIGGAYFVYAGETNRAEAIAKAMGPFYTLIKNKFYIDELYLLLTQAIFRFVSAPIAWFDRHIVDGAMNLTAALTRAAGKLLNDSQTGQVQTYGMWLVNGAILVVLFIWFVQQ